MYEMVDVFLIFVFKVIEYSLYILVIDHNLPRNAIIPYLHSSISICSVLVGNSDCDDLLSIQEEGEYGE